MGYRIDRAAVIGSGVMGSGIAALLANVGIPVYLFDLPPAALTTEEKKRGLTLADREVRNRIVQDNLRQLMRQKPAPFFTKERIRLITPCNMEDDLERLREADWIVEAVTERLDVKRDVLAAIEPFRQENAIVSSNTSGLSLQAMAEGRQTSFRKHFLGTHFFNPPRYLRLMELIPAPETGVAVVQFMRRFAEEVLGKGVVLAKDTPNFIANRIGCYGLMVTIDEMIKGNYSVGEVDSATGPAIGRPKSATFRTLDLVGLDTFCHVVQNMQSALSHPGEKAVFQLPSFMERMVERGLLGAKSGRGFYQKVGGKEGGQILELDYQTLQYMPRRRLNAPSLQLVRRVGDVRERLNTIAYAGDRAGQLVWNVLKRVLLYTAQRWEEIADDIVSIDQAMKWGFGWELGPFESWDALGLERSLARMRKEGEPIPRWLDAMLAKGITSFYRRQEGKRFFVHRGAYRQLERSPQSISLAELKEAGRVIKRNAGAALLDLGDGVALLEFTSPNNAIGPDIIHLLWQTLEEVDKNYEGLVIGNQGRNFCVGANLMLILLEAQEMNWPEIERMVSQFQQATQAIRFSRKPVVAAPFAMTLGGGAEVCLHAAGIQAAAETYMGLVETGVGLIPGGGGCKELLYRLYELSPEGARANLSPLVQQAFETIALAKVSASAEEARHLGFLRPHDGISLNQDHLIYAAKQRVLSLAQEGYRPPQHRLLPVVGREGKAVLLLGAYTLKQGGRISEHDYKIAQKLAHVLSGGDLPQGTLVTEEYLLELEREAFLSLCGEPKTQQRMQHMLAKGRPLRN